MSPTPTQDTLFPSASVGRAGSSKLQRIASHESLNAHPLLSSSSPSSSVLSQASTTDTSLSAVPRYVPYTPRQRPPTSSATTGMSPYSSLPVASHQHHHGGATSKLQLQNLKAAAQGIGLGTGSIGWIILEKLVEGEGGSEWDEIWTIITTAKPTLLLPLEPYSGEVITPEFVRDHVAFCNGPSPSPLVTLSGLRGSISNGTLIIQSTLPITSKPFRDLLKPDSQSTTLMSLPPLPFALLPNLKDSCPSFALSGSTSLPLPPRSHAYKPPLPPRPGTTSSTPPKSTSVPRISNPFTSFFRRPDPPSSSGNPNPPSPSQISLPGEDAHSVSGTCAEVAALSVSRKIVKKSIGKEHSKLIKDEIKAGLANCPTWVVDRVIDFTGPLHPNPKVSKRIDLSRASSGVRSGLFRRDSLTLPPSTQPPSDPSALAELFQDFYTCIEEDLRAGPGRRTFISRRREEKRTVSQSQSDSNSLEADSLEDEKENDQTEKEVKDSDIRILEILEQVEGTMCSVFYDRVFRPVSGDDASHDDALANRIAALNMLDLGLEHLGVELPNGMVESDVHNVVKACGTILQRLEEPASRSPGRKSALLVEAHKQIVDGISRLPQIRLKSERDFEAQDQKTPRSSSFAEQAAKESLNGASVLPPESEPPPPAVVTEARQNAHHTDDTGVPSSQLKGGLVPSLLSRGDTDDKAANVARSTGQSLDSVVDATGRSSLSSDDSPPVQESSPSVKRSSTPLAVSGDLLFPLLIFSVVKANPSNLVSHLLYTQRFRSRSVGGQESYCLINLMAVVEFLEHVDMGALGLGDSDRVMSTEALTPIPLAHGLIDSNAPTPSPFSTRLGKRVNQQVEELAGLADSANKVITGVVDSSFGVIRGFLTSNPDLSTPHGEDQDSTPWNAMRPSFGLLKRASGFSIANVAASLPGTGRPKTEAEEGQQLLEVSSRPASVKEPGMGDEKEEGDTNSSMVSEDDSPAEEIPDRGDARSIKSFSSMMSRESRDRDRDRGDGKERMSLTSRLANVSARTKIATPPAEQPGGKASPSSSKPTSRPSSWLPAPSTQLDIPPLTGAGPQPPKIHIPPPSRRFLECSEQDVRIGEVGELLREYRRMVQALRSVGAFEEHL